MLPLSQHSSLKRHAPPLVAPLCQEAEKPNLTSWADKKKNRLGSFNSMHLETKGHISSIIKLSSLTLLHGTGSSLQAASRRIVALFITGGTSRHKRSSQTGWTIYP